jgi:hypothetical protein
MPGIYSCTLKKGKETFTMLWTDGHAAEALETLGRWASNPDLAFTWFNAAVMAKAIRSKCHFPGNRISGAMA